jgi:ABC-type multidrug transport system fused ATPase/permease subunit
MEALRILYRSIGPRRRRQLALTLSVMLAGAFAELVTIGAVLPFLALLTRQGRAALPPLAARALAALGLDTMLAVCLLLIGAALAAAAIRLLLLALSQRLVMAIGHDVAVAIFARMLRQPYGEYVRRNSSEVLASMEKVRDVASGILQPAMQGLIGIVLACFIAALLFAISPFAASAASLSITLVYVGISRLTRARLRRNSRALAGAATDRVKIIQEGLGGIRDIILDRSQPLFEDEFRAIDRRYRRSIAINGFISQAPRYAIEAAGITTIALIALAMSFQPGGILRAIPVLGALALGAQRLLPLIQQAYSGWSASTGNLQSLADIAQLLGAPVLAEPPDDGRVLPFDRAIRLRQIGFRYGEGAWALDGIDLDIPRGARLGIAGTTGSGKSTLLDLLMGLLEPETGAILVDGIALDPATRPLWQARIAHVPQAIYLIDASIAANIAFGQKGIDRDRVRACARAAHLDDFVAGLPAGYDTEVGERGIRLSGGQRQRIGIARALYKQAPVLILDEATSALDDATEKAVMRSIMALGPEITIVMIAHRGSSLEGCDRIVRMEGGRIVELRALAGAEKRLASP